MATFLSVAWLFVLTLYTGYAQLHMREGVSLTGGTASQGFIQLTYNGRTGFLCADHVGREEAKVICHDLGLPNQHPSILPRQGLNDAIFVTSRVSCRGDEVKLSDCLHDNWVMAATPCSGDGAAFISCQADPCIPSPCQNGGQCELASSKVGYRCNCTSAWTGNHCTSDVNECANHNAGCSDQCVNTVGGYSCACAQDHLQVGPDNHTCTVPGEHVTCDSDVMELTFEKASFPSLHREHLSLKDASCVATENATHIILRAPLTACGTTSQKEGSLIVYQNVVHSVEEVVEGVVTRVKEVEVPFQCLMDLREVLEVPVHVDTEELHFLLKGSGNHDVGLQFSANGRFHQGQGHQVSVYPGQELYGQLTLNTLDPNLGVTLSNCTAATTLQHNSTNAEYTVLDQGCPADTTLVMINRTQPIQQDFHMQAFKFLSNDPQVAFHCDVSLCDPSGPDVTCQAPICHSASG